MAELETLLRNRYFYGKLLDPENLGLEQRYFNRKRWLLNRLALGRGALRGLDVVATADGVALRVTPGVAIDGLGREVIVPAESRAVDPRALTDDRGRPTGARVEGPEMVTVWIAYHECETAPERVLVADAAASSGCAYGAIAERYAVLVRPRMPLPLPGAFDLSALATPGADVAAVVARAVTEAPLDPPADPAVPLAEIRLGTGGVTAVDVTHRAVAASNELLLALLLARGPRP
jgi:hypothetical protein